MIMRRLTSKIANKNDEFTIDTAAIQSSYSKSRRSFCRSSSSSLSSALSIVSSRKSFSYDKLSQAPIHLTVVKLDGSFFEIEVVKMAKVSDLKQAVESAFSHLPTQGLGEVSWQHVWVHFCLSFRGQKLLNDVDCIKSYGIMDGDELHVVRHKLITYNLIKKRSAKQKESLKPCTMPIKNNEMEKIKLWEDDDDQENRRPQLEDNSNHNEPMLSHSSRRWFLYSRDPRTENVKVLGKANQSRRSSGFVGCFRTLFPLCENRNHSYSSRFSRIEI